METKTFETFRDIGPFELRQLTQEQPSCFNGMVRVEKYRVTVEKVEESVDVIRARVRYVLHPGRVTSAADGQEHFVGGPQLAALYGVDIRDVVFGDRPGYRERPGDVHLHPRWDGDYSLPSGA